MAEHLSNIKFTFDLVQMMMGLMTKLFRFRYWDIVLVFLVTSGIMFYYYGDYITNPNNRILSGNGDGIKNYYTYLYHITHDSSYMHFEGMNYPFGEYVMFTDNQPSLSNPMKLIGNDTLGIHHLLIYLSYSLGAVFLYLLFKREGITQWLAVLFAIIIALMSPQIWLMKGHFSMSYACFVPVQFYLLRRFDKDGMVWFYVLTAVTLMWFFFHPYLGMISVIFTSFFYLVKGVWHLIRRRFNWKNVLKWIGVIGLPTALFLMINAIFDHHPNRSDYPIGFFEFTANDNMYFLPTSGPIREVLANYFPAYQQPGNGIGLLYMGVLTMFIVGFGLVGYIIARIRKEERLFSAFQICVFGGGILMLFFSYCYPFKLGLEGWADYIGPFRQFRTLERFGWVASYAMMVSAVFVLNAFLVRMRHAGLRVAVPLVILIAVVYLLDVGGIHKYNRTVLDKRSTQNPFQMTNVPEYLKEPMDRIDRENYSAILAFPYYHFASEVIDVSVDEISCYNAFILSYHTGLPMFNSNMSRTSFDESKMALNLLAPAWVYKNIQTHITDKRDILILHSKHRLRVEEEEILKRAELIAENDQVALYTITFDALFRFYEIDIEDMKNRSEVVGSDQWATDSTAVIHFNSYNDLPGQHIKIPRDNMHLLYEIPAGVLELNTRYEVSVWVRHKDVKNPDALLFADVHNDSTNEHFNHTEPLRFSCFALDNEWARIRLRFMVTKPNDRVEIRCYEPARHPGHLVLDNLCVMKDNQAFIHPSVYTGQYMLNNHFIGKVNDQ